MADDQDYTAPQEGFEDASAEGVADAEAVAAFYRTLTRKFLLKEEAIAFTLKYIESLAIAKAKLNIELPPEPPEEKEGWRG